MYSWHCDYISCIVIYSIEQMELGVRLDFRNGWLHALFVFYKVLSTRTVYRLPPTPEGVPRDPESAAHGGEDSQYEMNLSNSSFCFHLDIS